VDRNRATGQLDRQATLSFLIYGSISRTILRVTLLCCNRHFCSIASGLKMAFRVRAWNGRKLAAIFSETFVIRGTDQTWSPPRCIGANEMQLIVLICYRCIAHLFPSFIIIVMLLSPDVIVNRAGTFLSHI